MFEIYMTPQEVVANFPWQGDADGYIEGCLLDNCVYQTTINGEIYEVFQYEHYVNPNMSDYRVVIPRNDAEEAAAWREWYAFEDAAMADEQREYYEGIAASTA